MLSDAETDAALAAMQAGRGERRFLVLGGTGNVGKHAVLALAKGAEEVEEEAVKILVGSRTPDSFWSTYRHPPRCRAVVQPVQCDLSSPESVGAAVAAAAASRVFLCLPQALSAQQMEAVSNAAVDAAKASGGVQRLVRVGSLGIDGDGPGQGPLGAAHVASEEYCRAAGVALSSVRPTSFHTNFLAYDAESLRKEDLFRSPLGSEARVNWVHCADIGRVAAVLLLRPETDGRGDEVVEVTGPPEATLSAPEMAALLTEELGRPIRYEEVAPPPVQEYVELWAFLRAGGFGRATGTVEALTGQPALDFRAVVRENKEALEP